tara:strand:- start:1185 stop:1397 length:213 start_codon:yes stop_codon:yes gene_type:complete
LISFEIHELGQAKKSFETVLEALANSKCFQYGEQIRNDATQHFKESDKPFHITYGFHSATIYLTKGTENA